MYFSVIPIAGELVLALPLCNAVCSLSNFTNNFSISGSEFCFYCGYTRKVEVEVLLSLIFFFWV